MDSGCLLDVPGVGGGGVLDATACRESRDMHLPYRQA